MSPRPYLLVGHSLGGLNARVYNALYPQDLAGAVLVDAAHEDEPHRAPAFMLGPTAPRVLWRPIWLTAQTARAVGGVAGNAKWHGDWSLVAGGRKGLLDGLRESSVLTGYTVQSNHELDSAKFEPSAMADFQWYAAVLLFQSQVGSDWEDDPLVDHQVTLIRAIDPEAAYAAALEIGAGGEHSYRNEDGDTVAWNFIGLADLEELSEAPRHGAEVFSWRTRGRADRDVRAKADLTVFANRRDPNKTARELLDE